MKPIEEVNLDEMVAKAEVNLNDAYKHYTQATSPLAKEFVELKLQVCIFQYDICVELTTVVRNQPTGFAVAVALKGMVLRLFEFDARLRGTLLPRLLTLSKARDIEVASETVQQLKRDWKLVLHKLQGWHHIRNEAAGHYGRDTPAQIAALETLVFDEVMTVAVGFLQFSQEVYQILRDAGRGVVGDDRPLPNGAKP